MKNSLPIIGISLYVIVTMIDVLLVSLPMTLYIAVLACGALLIMSFFLDISKLPQKIKKAHEPKHTVYHFRRQPLMETYAK